MSYLELRKVKLTDFIKNAVGASIVGEYWYCAAKISNQKLLGKIKTPIMIEGAELHEEQAKEALSQLELRKVKAPETLLDALVFNYAAVKHAIARKSCLVNSEKSVMYLAILPELGCIGVPDLIDCSSGSPIVVEKKFVSNLPYRPWPDQQLQLAVYMLSLEKIGFNPSHGILDYFLKGTDKNKRFTITLDDYLRRKIRDTIENVKGLINRGEAPIPTSKPRKCQVCEYANTCQWRTRSYDSLNRFANGRYSRTNGSK